MTVVWLWVRSGLIVGPLAMLCSLFLWSTGADAATCWFLLAYSVARLGFAVAIEADR